LLSCFVASAKVAGQRDSLGGERKAEKTAVGTNNAARLAGGAVAMANHWPPEVTALFLVAGRRVK
jgi:hypothetical protein